jgi:glutamate---cysteine ligase / carboxylate-amine ligase
MAYRILGRAGRRTSPTHKPAMQGLRLEPDARGADLRERFDSIAPFTIGAEEEFMLVDPETLGLLPVAKRALAVAEGDPRVRGEFRASQLESVTPICVTVSEVERELASVRDLLASSLGDSAWLVASGTHPTANHPGAVSHGLRYREMAESNPWAARHMLTCGLHVHVAVGGVERTLAVYNALRSYLPEIIALGANAPIYRDEDSGLATVRPKLNGFKPRTGLPPAFASWEELTEFTSWARKGGEVPDESHHWWDIRLNTRHATLEVRAADTQTRVKDAATIAALVQSLVVELANRYDAGEVLPVARDERIKENMWLATRNGLNGWLIDLETGQRIPTIDRLQELADSLFDSARSVGCEDELGTIAALAADGGGATRQRKAYERGGAEGLIVELAGETAGAEIAIAPARQPVPTAIASSIRRPRFLGTDESSVRSRSLEVVAP